MARSRHRHRHRHRFPFIRRKPPPGAVPGTLAVDPAAPKPAIRVFTIGPSGAEETTVADPDGLRAHVGKTPLIWVNIDGLGDAEAIRRIGEQFDIHGLALEDVIHVHQRAKVEPYGGQLFIVARMVHADDELCTEQVSMFVGENYVLTFQERPGDSFDQVRARIRAGLGRILEGGAAYLAYALLDELIDAYFPVLERVGEEIESAEHDVLDDPGRDLVTRIHAAKRDLLMIRRAVQPHREMLAVLLRADTPMIDDQTRVYLRDCQDHAIQLLDIIDTYRELANGVLDVYLSTVSQRLNEVMKVLTIFAAIFIPLTFIAGLYGMNFKYMPELSWHWGYPMVVGVMLASAIGLLVFFWRRGWIGGGR